MINKLVYPSFFDVTPVTVYLVDGINEDGEENVIETWTGKCNFSEKTKSYQDKNGQWQKLSGIIHIGKDIFPNYSVISGYVIINNRKMEIITASRLRNPDGSINHTRLELK